MSDQPRKLTQQELVRVLQKAAEREGREGPRSFSADEVVEAGRDLGLSPDTVAAELAALARRQDDTAAAPRPFDTRITVEATPEQLVVEMPALGLHGAVVAKLGGGALLVGFLSFWIWGAAQSSVLFAALAVPFWALGLATVGGGLRAMVTSRRLELGRESGVLVSRPFGRRRLLQTAELRVRLTKLEERTEQGQEDSAEEPSLTLEHGTQTIPLLRDHSRAEQRWIHAELSRWLDG